MFKVLVSMCVAFGSVASAGMLQSRELIERALDEPANITLENVRLGDALARITEQTGVPVEMPPEAMRLTPYGADTVMEHVDIVRVSLREGLRELFGRLGMTFQVLNNRVRIVPAEALRRLGRPPTWSELDVLGFVSNMQPGLDGEALSSLKPRMRFDVPVPDGWRMLSQAIRGVGAGRGDEVLTVACGHFGWTWRPEGNLLVVTTQQQDAQRRLQQPVSLRVNNRPLVEAVQALGREAGVAVRIEPGAVGGLPLAMQRNFSINVESAPAEEVLDRIAGYTGLGWVIEGQGVVFYVPSRSAGAAETPADRVPAASGGDPYVAKMVVELRNGKTLEWLIRRSELPEDLQRMRERDLAELFEAARQR